MAIQQKKIHGLFHHCRLGGSAEVDLERGESDVGEAFTPQILAGYYTARSAPTEAGEKCQKVVEFCQIQRGFKHSL